MSGSDIKLDDITPPPERPRNERTISQLEKATIQHVERQPNKIPVAAEIALLDNALMAGERQEKLNPFVIFLALVAAVSGFCFGYDTGVISASLVSIRDDLGHALSDTEKEWISTGTSCGALIGALLSGALCDKIGRKWVLAFGDLWFILGAVIICSSFSVPQIITGRVVLGFGVGTAAGIAPLYIAELAPTRFRGALVTVQSIAITGGQFFSYCIGIPLTGHGGWRIQFAIGIVPALAQAAGIHFLPESPRYDLLRGRKEAALKTIRRSVPTMSDDYVAIKFAALEAVVELSSNFQREYPFRQRVKLILTKGKYGKPAITVLGIGVFQQLSGFNSLLYYSATIFAQAGFTNASSVGLVVSGTNLFFTIVSMILLDRVGKRRILLSTYPGMIAGLALAAVAFWYMTAATGHRLIDGVDYPKNWSNMMLGMMVIFIGFYATGSGNIAWTAGEFFPLEMRGLGTSILAGGVWAANIVISATFLTLMNAIGPTPTFSLYAGISFLGLIFIFFCYPEPSGLSLEEIQVIYEYGFGVAKSRQIRAEHKAAQLEERRRATGDMTDDA
ncbi:general substrate transporter [Naematelia encephala]|uniref:General substrate transporter n=1 Tax=Naematelia encephala TaxID=71784 RepID=A0A1Y2B7F6_9TREE|nr:general substrate transporter [Naematelia encephala]